jgi:GAF domain-containing protein
MSPRTPLLRPDQRRGDVKLEVFQQIRTEIKKMHSTLDLGPLLWVVCDGLSRLGLRFDFFGINLIDAQSSPPSGTAHFRTPAGGWGQYSYRDLTGSSLLAIWNEHHLVYRRDLQAADPYGERQELDNPGLRSLVDIPFSHGTLALSSVLPEAFGADDLELLQEMAALCTEGFGRLDELRALERRAQEAEALSAAIAVVAGTSGLEEVFQVVVREAVRLTNADRGTLFLYDENEKVLVPRAHMGHRWEIYSKIRLQPGEDVSGQVLVSGEATLYDHDRSLAEQTLRPENRALLDASIQTPGGAGAVVPLKLGGRVLGTLSVYSKQHRSTQRDLVLLERLAAQAALAIERARHARELSLNLALQQVRNETLRMSEAEDWTRVRIAFQEELSRLVRCCRCSIQLVDQARGRLVSFGSMAKPGPSGKAEPSPVELRAGLRWVVEQGRPLYRRSRAEIESWGEVEIRPEINSVVDVPFAGGTLAMNSMEENAFNDQDLQVLQRFA